MNNFGVIELASTKTTHAPGWAYVPDVAPAAAAASASVSGNRKRAARNQQASSGGGANLSARFDAKVRKEIEVLDRDNARDVNIPVPGKGNRLLMWDDDDDGDEKYAATSTKHTPNVRKILQSAKTFANHLDDFTHTLEHNPQTSFFPLAPPLSGAAAASHSKNKKGATTKQAPSKKSASKSRSKSKGKAKAKYVEVEEEEEEEEEETVEGDGDVVMADAGGEGDTGGKDGEGGDGESGKAAAAQPAEVPKIPLLAPLAAELIPPPHPADGDPLLMSRIPPPPTGEEIEALVTARPLTYVEARARWPEDSSLHAANGGQVLEVRE
ncbi:hypothetical protein MKZ38_003104 [Zalerion maritima]|uniref:Uncharacterized protein n=1 Tax=Zalerion maritima TaxID=339359 RepID=A0AAD5RWZ2_9PEZI|nr:hypothetical protein MKZ38_003104 [Zalerion maritima]